MNPYLAERWRHHIAAGGLFHAVGRGLGYILFLFRKAFGKSEPPEYPVVIEKGGVRVEFLRGAVRVFRQGVEVTVRPGLNIALKTRGAWLDSSKARWRVLSLSAEAVKFGISFPETALTFSWSLFFEGEDLLKGFVEFGPEGGRVIEEARYVCLARPEYKSWFMDEVLGDWPRADKRWHDKATADRSISVVGVRFARRETGLPDLMFEPFSGTFGPVLQKPPLPRNTAIFGLRALPVPSVGLCALGVAMHFCGDAAAIDRLVEEVRQRWVIQSGAGPVALPVEARPVKVLLVNLPWERDGRWGVRAGSRWPHLKDAAEEGYYQPFPFFMACAASLLCDRGFEVRVIDALAEKMPEQVLLEKVRSWAPDLLVAEISTPSLENDLRILEDIRRSAPGVMIGLAGPDVSVRVSGFLRRREFVDLVLVGEYEFILLEVVRALSRGSGFDDIKGLLFRRGGDIVETGPAPALDVDALPWPTRASLPMDRYLDAPGGIPLPSVQMLASRGCPFSCHFCLWPQVMYRPGQYRARRVEDVVDEMEYLVRHLGFRSVYFDDDTFNVGRERMLRFSREVRRRGLHRTPWAVMARADLMDPEVLKAMRSAGLAAVKYGVESAVQGLVDEGGKALALERAERMIRLTQALGIKVHLTFMIGLPGETSETIRATLDLVRRLDPDSAQFSVATPFPGTRFYESLEAQGAIVEREASAYDGQGQSVFRTPTMSASELASWYRRANEMWEAHLRRRQRGVAGAWRKVRDITRRGAWGLTWRRSWERARARAGRGLLTRLLHGYLDILGVMTRSSCFKGPDTLQIDLTDRCNNDCLCCWCRSPLLSEERRGRPAETLPAALVMRTIGQARRLGLKEIYFSGGGEPFMHPDLLGIAAYARRLGVRCSVNTNFTLVDEKAIEAIFRARVEHLTVSVWAGTAATYKALHPNKTEADFEALKARLTLLNSRKRTRPRVKVYHVLCAANYREIDAMVRFAVDTKSEAVEFAVLDTVPGATDALVLDDAQRAFVCERLRAWQTRQEREAYPTKILGLDQTLRRFSSPEADRAVYDRPLLEGMPCYAGWLFARIMPNGDVNSCLKAHRIPVGNIHRETFASIWFGEKEGHFRRKASSSPKSDPFFRMIGNDPGTLEAGCYKGCDDLGRNLSMHRRLERLSEFERRCLKAAARIMTGSGG